MKKLLLLLILILFPLQAFAIGNPLLSAQSSSAESSHVLKSSAGSLLGLIVTAGASAGYVLVYDAKTAPSNGTVTPVLCFYMPATSTIVEAWETHPLAFNNGIVAVFSTTGCFSQTTSSTAFIHGQVQ